MPGVGREVRGEGGGVSLCALLVIGLPGRACPPTIFRWVAGEVGVGGGGEKAFVFRLRWFVRSISVFGFLDCAFSISGFPI